MNEKRVLTKREEWDICFDYVVGFPIRVISERYNLSRSGINRVVTRLGVGSNRGKRAGV
jgi:hypothetical protein